MLFFVLFATDTLSVGSNWINVAAAIVIEIVVVLVAVVYVVIIENAFAFPSRFLVFTASVLQRFGTHTQFICPVLKGQ